MANARHITRDELDEEGDGRKAESFVFRPLNLIEQRTLAKHVRSWKNAEVSDRRAHGNENTTGANGGSLH